MTEEQKKQCEEIINSWNWNMNSDFHSILMSMAAVLGKDKDITEENYKEKMDEVLLEIFEAYGCNEEEFYKSREEVNNMLDNGTIKIPQDDFQKEFEDYLLGLRKILYKPSLSERLMNTFKYYLLELKKIFKL